MPKPPPKPELVPKVEAEPNISVAYGDVCCRLPLFIFFHGFVVVFTGLGRSKVVLTSENWFTGDTACSLSHNVPGEVTNLTAPPLSLQFSGFRVRVGVGTSYPSYMVHDYVPTIYNRLNPDHNFDWLCFSVSIFK